MSLSWLGAAGFTGAALAADQLPANVRQLVVSIAPDASSIHGRMLALERGPGTLNRENNSDWCVAPGLGSVPVLFGKNGLAWGRGILGNREVGPQKVERDARAPAGVFRIGKIYTYNNTLPQGAHYPFHTVTEADAWIDDPKLPQLYNRHVRVDLRNPPPWFDSQKMRHNDEAYRYLIEIRHNADPPEPGMGSAIFFHTRRGEDRPTWGCTTMKREDLVTLMCWLRAEAHPHYVLLTWADYQRLWAAWGLPHPKVVASIAPATASPQKR